MMPNETTFQVAPTQIVYAVWIRGYGWLKEKEDDARTTFAAFSPEVAESAAHLWGKDAEVLPFDQSLLDLESKFLAREKELSDTIRPHGPRSFLAWLRQHGILG